MVSPSQIIKKRNCKNWSFQHQITKKKKKSQIWWTVYVCSNYHLYSMIISCKCTQCMTHRYLYICCIYRLQTIFVTAHVNVFCLALSILVHTLFEVFQWCKFMFSFSFSQQWKDGSCFWHYQQTLHTLLLVHNMNCKFSCGKYKTSAILFYSVY